MTKFDPFVPSPIFEEGTKFERVEFEIDGNKKGRYI